MDRPKDVRRSVEELRRRIEDARSQIDELSRQTAREARHGWHDFRQTWDEARRGWVDGARSANGDDTRPPGTYGAPRTGRNRTHYAHQGTRWVMSSPTGTTWDRDDWRAWKQQRRQERAASRQRRRERRRQDTAWIGLVLLCIGVAWLASETTSLRLPVEASLAAGLILLGVVVLSTPKSRRLWPVVMGCAIIAVLMGSTAHVGMPAAFTNPRFGNHAVQPIVVDDLRQASGTNFGNVTLDLRCLQAPTALTSINTIRAFGNVTVFVPKNLAVRLDGEARFGNWNGPHIVGSDPLLTIPVDDVAGNVDVRLVDPDTSTCPVPPPSSSAGPTPTASHA